MGFSSQHCQTKPNGELNGVRFYPSEKYYYSSQLNGKLIQMFQTTNHLMLDVLDSWRKPTYYKHLQAR